MLAQPWILLAAPIYLGIEALIYYIIRRRSITLATALYVRPEETWRTRATKVMRYLPMITALFLLVALSRPQQEETHEEVLPSGIDIVVALDASGSMAAEDFQPLNRLAVAKDVLKDFIRGRPSDRIGLILFAGRSVTRSPLTLEHQPLIQTVDAIRMGDLPEGTAIGSAIMSGMNRLSGKEKKGQKILVLMTDGRNNAGEIHPRDALAMAAKSQVKIYTIGVGSYGPVPFAVPMPDGKKVYRYERADLDESLLREIAEKTGGRYFRASDPKSLQGLFAQINRLEKSEPRILKTRSIRDQSTYFMIPAILLAGCYLTLNLLIVRLP